MKTRFGIVVFLGCFFAGCGSPQADPPAVIQTDPNPPPSFSKPLYQFSERDVDQFLPQLQRTEADLHQRIVTLARMNLGQPYQLYLLGESPFETIDAEPIFCLDKSDCVVFAEHTLAMALTESWESFLAMLQRIRYRDGHISVLSRNHYTEADWNRNNAWLLRDITEEVGGAHVVRWTQKVDRAKFFKDRYKLDTSIPVESNEETFIPHQHMNSVKPLLRDGDVVNFVSGRGNNYWVGHVGLIALGPNGTVNLIHSASPAVREEPMDDYIARAANRDPEKSGFRGFKFLRVVDDPMANLRKIDGPGAPRVSVPADSPLTWGQYMRSFQTGG